MVEFDIEMAEGVEQIQMKVTIKVKITEEMEMQVRWLEVDTKDQVKVDEAKMVVVDNE